MKFQFSSSVPPRDKLYYLASPYSGHDPEEIFNLNREAMSFLLKEGYFVFSPILHTNSIAHISSEHWFWMNQDYAILKKCDGLIVLHAEGWDKSVGVREEMAISQSRNMNIYHLIMDS